MAQKLNAQTIPGLTEDETIENFMQIEDVDLSKIQNIVRDQINALLKKFVIKVETHFALDYLPVSDSAEYSQIDTGRLDSWALKKGVEHIYKKQQNIRIEIANILRDALRSVPADKYNLITKGDVNLELQEDDEEGGKDLSSRMDELSDDDILLNFLNLTPHQNLYISSSVYRTVNTILTQNKITIPELDDVLSEQTQKNLFVRTLEDNCTNIGSNRYYGDYLHEALPLLFRFPPNIFRKSQIAQVLVNEMLTVLPPDYIPLRNDDSKKGRPEFGRTTEDEDSEFDVVDDDEDSEFEVVDDDQPINLAEDENLAINDESEESPIASSSVQQPQHPVVPPTSLRQPIPQRPPNSQGQSHVPPPPSPSQALVPPSVQRPPSRQVPPNPQQSLDQLPVPQPLSHPRLPVPSRLHQSPDVPQQEEGQHREEHPPQEERRREEPPNQHRSGQGNNATHGQAHGHNEHAVDNSIGGKMKRFATFIYTDFIDASSDTYWLKVGWNPKKGNHGDSHGPKPH